MKRGKPVHYRDYRSLGGKIVVALVMIAVIPYLLLIYLFFNNQIDFTETFIFFLPLILISILAGFSLLRRSADQLSFLSQEIAGLESGEKNGPIQIQGDRELNEIASHFNKMMQELEKMKRKNQEQATQLMIYSRDLALSYQKTKQEEALRNRLSRYVGNNLVEKLVNLKDGVLLETERREVTILFADIRSFTAIAERMEADDVVLMLNQYFSIMVDTIFKNNGLLDKFVGDQLIAHELIQQTVVLENRVHHDTEILIEHQDDVVRLHPLGDGCKGPDIGEQDRHFPTLGFQQNPVF